MTIYTHPYVGGLYRQTGWREGRIVLSPCDACGEIKQGPQQIVDPAALLAWPHYHVEGSP